MNIPETLRYTKSHEWVKIEEDIAVVGITDFAQEQLTDITYVELPSVGDTVSAGSEAAVVESVKAASDIYTPLEGQVVAANEALEDQPELVNQSPYENGWLFKLKLSDISDIEDLLTATDYQAIVPDA